MTWRRDEDSNGLPVWRGEDSILNTRHLDAQQLGCAEVGIWLLIALAAVMIYAGSTGNKPVDGLGAAVGWLVLIPSVLALYVVRKSRQAMSARQWVSPKWELRATATGFSFKRDAAEPLLPAAQWTVAYGDIARVEVGRTAEWQPGRTIETPSVFDKLVGESSAVVTPTSEHERQVFLFMADHSRRVVYSVNANPETTGTLAHSLRSWLAARPTTQRASGELGDD